MKLYILEIHDDRYGTPTMEVVTALDDDGARKVGRERLERTRHHLAVDIWDDDRSVGSVRRTS